MHQQVIFRSISSHTILARVDTICCMSNDFTYSSCLKDFPLFKGRFFLSLFMLFLLWDVMA